MTNMRLLNWSTSNAVFVTAIDDEHKEIFDALSRLRTAFLDQPSPEETGQLMQSLIASIDDHFAHEERLMRAALYDFLPWHKRLHRSARKRVGQYAERIAAGEAGAVPALIDYLSAWLHGHTRLPDAMLGAFLRNNSLCRLTFRAGTKPVDACAWYDSRGKQFDPGPGGSER
jgi:hemerythrin